jgi:hypothetical protein
MAIHTTTSVPITPATPTDDHASKSCHNAIDESNVSVQAARVGRTVARDRLFRNTRRRNISNAAAQAARTFHYDSDDSNDSSYALEEDDSKSNFDDYDYDGDGWQSDISDRDSSSCQNNLSNDNDPMVIDNDYVMHIDNAEATTHIIDDSVLTIDATNEEIINEASSRVWGVPFLRPFQMMAVLKILFDVRCKKKLLLVDRTGGGKSHILRMIASLTGGIWLVIIPLLSLTADTKAKMEEANEDYGSVEVHHMDELPVEDKSSFSRILHRMRTFEQDSSSTIFLFVSPQYIAKNHAFRSTLIQCSKKKH